MYNDPQFLERHQPEDEGKSCTDELEKKFGSGKWDKSDTERLKILHKNYEKAKELFEQSAD